jgi:uncharacterized protein
MRAHEFMTTPVLTVAPETPVAEASALLRDRDITTAPVVDEAQRLVGVISVADLLRGLFEPEPAQTVGAVMTRDVTALPQSADETDFAGAMIEHRVNSIPVVSGGRVVGIVSASDLLRARVRSDEDVARSEQPTDHRGLRVLGLDECMRRLRATPLGRLAFVQDGEPVVLPVNHGVDGLDVVFRTTWGSKLQVAEEAGIVAFEVDGFDADRDAGWSVLVKGTASVVYESADTDRVDQLDIRSWPGHEETFWVRLRPFEVTGRELTPRP